ncbi:hypothetical protein [Sporocytophaga myxococcoides]|uniref:hypothetical protein n=1 Tax=Sporocytophaga myxococcoides TaxID=153721 RepID=UPI00041D93CB|nr:hypothetical protein [Sporocytophaga myxococcoides]
MKKIVTVIFISLFFAGYAQSQSSGIYDNYFIKNQYDFLYSRKISYEGSAYKHQQYDATPLKKNLQGKPYKIYPSKYLYRNSSRNSSCYFTEHFVSEVAAPIITDILRNLN